MWRILCGFVILSLTTCSTSNPQKKMTIKGKATKGIQSKSAINGGYVTLVTPGKTGWKRVLFDSGSSIDNIATTTTDGSFTFEVQFDWWTEVFSTGAEDRPVFLAATDSAGTFTELAMVPVDKVTEGGSLTVDVTPQSTVAGLWQCPHGKFASPTPACPANAVCQASGGFPCYQQPEQSKTTEDFVTSIESTVTSKSLAEPDPTNWSAFITSLLAADPALLEKIKASLRNKGFTIEFEITSSFITSEYGLEKIPTIQAPTSADANDDSSSAGSADSGATCSPGFGSSCKTCSISACATSERAYYKTSNGQYFYCASQSNCTSAASRVLSYCGCLGRASHAGMPTPGVSLPWVKAGSF